MPHLGDDIKSFQDLGDLGLTAYYRYLSKEDKTREGIRALEPKIEERFKPPYHSGKATKDAIADRIKEYENAEQEERRASLNFNMIETAQKRLNLRRQ